MSGSDSTDPRKLRPGPIRHGSLPPELLKQINAIHDVIGSYVAMPLEQFEITFMRDAHPKDEVAIWCCIVAAWHDYHEKYLGSELLPDDEEKKLLAALISVSTGVDDPKVLGLPEEVGRRLLACYDGADEE